MGPRRFRQGNVSPVMTTLMISPLQWGPADSGRETRRGRPPKRESGSAGFNGAPPIQAGKPGSIGHCGDPCSSFNGAPPIQAGKPALSPKVCLQLDCFNGAPPIQAGKPLNLRHAGFAPFTGFNGAPPIQAGKLCRTMRIVRVWRKLQWGPADSGRETYEASIMLAQAQRASMGPRRFRQGNIPRPARDRRPGRRFNGAPPIQAGKLQRRERTSTMRSSFNGAPPIQAGKPGENPQNQSSNKASMGPRRFRQGNGRA